MTGPLYAIAEWFLVVLPVDDAGRRVFDETLADWRREAAKARGTVAGALVFVRAIFSVFRSIVGVSLREVTSIHRSGVLTRVCLWTVAYLLAYLAIVTVIVQLSPSIQFSPSMTKLSVMSLVYGQVPLIASFLPTALLLATGLGGKRQPVPGLGTALVALVISFPLLGWGVPIANRAFLDANPALVTYPNHPDRTQELRPWKPGEGLGMAMGMRSQYFDLHSHSPRPFGNDLTLGELRRTVASGPAKGGWAALAWLSFFGAYLATCVLAPVLASALRRLTALMKYCIVFVTVALLLTLLTLPVLTSLVGEFSVVMWLGAYWIPVTWMCLCLIAVTRRSSGAAEATP